jgi:hypothetical protein
MKVVESIHKLKTALQRKDNQVLVLEIALGIVLTAFIIMLIHYTL